MMTVAQRLRQKLLDLAIHGKLVPQDAHDEPADELLARIRKARSTQKGRARTPTAPLPVTDDEQPFDLPKGWTWCRLGDIGTWGAGTTPSRKNAAYYEDGEIPWLKTGDLNDGVITGVPEFVTQQALDETSLHVNPVGTVLIAMYGATIGKIGILGIEATTNQACCACQVAGCVVNKYLFYYLLSQRSKLKAMGGGGAQPNISKDIIVSYPIPLPPLAEQKRIVAALNEMLAAADAVAAGTEKIAALKEKARAKILDLAIRGKLVKQDCNDEPASELLVRIRNEELGIRNGRARGDIQTGLTGFTGLGEDGRVEVEKCRKGRARRSATAEPIPDDEKPFDLPKGWAWCRLGDVIDLLSGQDFPPYRYNDDGVGVPYITGASNFGSGGIIENRWTDTPTVIAVKGDFLLTCKGSGVGKTAVMDLPKGHIARQIMALRPCVGLTDKYLATYMQANFSLLRQSANGLIPGIQRSVVLEMVMPLPPLAEQKRIVTKVDEMLAACEKLGMRN